LCHTQARTTRDVRSMLARSRDRARALSRSRRARRPALYLL